MLLSGSGKCKRWNLFFAELDLEQNTRKGYLLSKARKDRSLACKRPDSNIHFCATYLPLPPIRHTHPTILRRQQLRHSPRLIRVAGYAVRVHKRLLLPPKQQVFGASVVVFVRVLFRVMPRHPVADHLAHDAGVRGHGVPVGFVVELAVLEACLLGAGDAFESVCGFRLLGKVVCLVVPFLTHDFGKGIESGNSPSFLFPLFFSCCR